VASSGKPVVVIQQGARCLAQQIEEATDMVVSYFDSGADLMYAVGGLLGLIGAEAPHINAVKIEQINFPKYDHREDKERIIITKKDYQSITIFRSYMDSLYTSEEGKNQYDSILQARPGLMDSVQLLEQIYLLQQKD